MKSRTAMKFATALSLYQPGGGEIIQVERRGIVLINEIDRRRSAEVKVVHKNILYRRFV